jgi:peptidyl-tRNA hydrolase
MRKNQIEYGRREYQRTRIGMGETERFRQASAWVMMTAKTWVASRELRDLMNIEKRLSPKCNRLASTNLGNR